MARVIKTPAAQEDLIEIAAWIEGDIRRRPSASWIRSKGS
jgi:plasmid stabilization system protein ParE